MNFLNKQDFDSLATNGKFAEECGKLYSAGNGVDYQVERYTNLFKKHSKFNSDKVLLFSSPGRIEVCGNHTDHNNGLVLCASISVDTIACVTPTDDNYITVASLGYPAVSIDINDLEVNPAEFGSSEGLVRGVCAYFKANGLKIGGFYATTTSDVFKGAGVSSSACFEVLMCEILNVLYNDGKIDALTKAYASHLAESQYFGKPCGLMDQSAIALDGVSYIDFESTSEPKVKSIPWKFDDTNILLINCGGDHCGLTDQYAAIREEMEHVAEKLGGKVLRNVTLNDVVENIGKYQTTLTGRSFLRAIHYFKENERVVKCADAIENIKLDVFYDMINASGNSSYKLLQNCYPENDTAQRIPLALAMTDLVREGKGAIRVHGGGFAGTMIAYVPNDIADKIIATLAPVFGEDNIFSISIRNSGARQVIIK